MRTIFIPAMLAVCAYASADLATAQAMMGPALFDLGSLTKVTIDRTGYEEVNGIQTSTNSRLAIQRTPISGGVLTQLELLWWKGGTLQTRIVAEIQPGTSAGQYEKRLWFYDAIKNTYSSWSYGHLPLDSADLSMIRTVKKVASPDDQILVQLAEEAELAAQTGEVAAANRWRPFLPLSQVNASGGSIQAVSNVGSRYTQIDYTITEPNPGEYHLSRIDTYAERPFGTARITTESTLTIHELSLAAGTSFVFNPGNARPVANSIFQGR